MKRIALLAIIAAMLGINLYSCTHPVSPSPTIPIPDSVTVTGPKIGYVNDSVKFSAHINFTPATPILYKWIFADSAAIQNDSIRSRIFKDSGRHIFALQVLRKTDSTLLCIAIDTILILDTTHHDTVIKPPPPDTTSHNFTWTQFLNVGNENDMTGCWAFSSNDIYVVNQFLYHFDGTSWSRATLNGHAPGALSGASLLGFTNSDFWIIDGSIMYHWDGNTVEETRLENTGVWHYPHDGIIHSAWGTSSSDMYFVGDSGTILHFDGTNWAKMNSGTEKRLNSIWGTGDNNIWASGYDPSTTATVLLHFDGSSWKEDNLSSSHGINAIGGFDAVWACDSASTHPFVTTCGALLARKTDNSQWRIDSSLTNKVGSQYIGLYYVTGNAVNDFITVGDGGFISHWNGANWYQYNSLYAPGDFGYVTNGLSMQGNTVCVVGIKDGQGWIEIGQR